MKQLLLFIFSIGASWIFAQSGIYSTNNGPGQINLNLEHRATNEYSISGAEQSNGQYQGFFSVHTPGNSVISTTIQLEQSETIISDQVLLATGHTFMTGVYRAASGHYEPFILEVDANGNFVNSMAFTGFPFPEMSTHKIIYSEAHHRFYICGSTAMDDPINLAFSHTQMAFVLAVEANTFGVAWSTFMDSGVSPSGEDYDMADDLAIVEDLDFQPHLAITGSMNGFGGNHQLLMVGIIDLFTGTSQPVNGYAFGSNAFGASIHQVYYDQFYVLVNHGGGIAIADFDVAAGNLIGPVQEVNPILPANQVLTGYDIDGRFDIARATIGGYVYDATSTPLANPTIAPFQLKIDLEHDNAQTSIPFDGSYFDAANVILGTQGAFAEFIGQTFVNTPDILIAEEADMIRLVGFRGNRFDVASTDLSGNCISNCETPIPATLAISNPPLTNQSIFNPQQVSPSWVASSTVTRIENPTDECQSQGLNCPQTCPVTWTQFCPTGFALSINCVNTCYGPPSYQWIIPTLNINDPASPNPVVSTATGGTHNYTLHLTYIVNGVPQTCTYTGTISLPAVTCNSLGIHSAISFLGNCDDYQIAFTDLSDGCLDISYDVSIDKLSSSGCNAFSGTQLPAISSFDIGSCGAGWYQINATANVQFNGQNILTCTLPTSFKYLDDYSFEPNISSVGVNGTGPCAPGVTSYIEAEVTNAAGFPSNSSCYDYYWNGVLGGPIHYCCYNGISNCNQIDLLIVDNCTGCSFYKPDIYLAPIIDGGGGTIIQEFETTTILEQADLIEVFPNPAFNELNVKLLPQTETSILDIYDIQGKLWIKAALSDAETTLDISSLPTGTYIAKALDVLSGSSEVLRFVKQ